MEWKSARTETPKIGRLYICIDTKGKYRIRRYEKVTVSNGKFCTIERAKMNGEFDENLIMDKFIPVDHDFGRAIKDPNYRILYFMEMPEPPSFVDEAKEIRRQIRLLEKQLEQLGGVE